MTHLKGEISRLKEKLQLADKSAAATQLQVRHLYRRIDTLEGKAKVGRPCNALVAHDKCVVPTAFPYGQRRKLCPASCWAVLVLKGR